MGSGRVSGWENTCGDDNHRQIGFSGGLEMSKEGDGLLWGEGFPPRWEGDPASLIQCQGMRGRNLSPS